MSYNSKYTGAEVEALLDAANGKQDAIEDLETIREGAALGATALQSYTEKYTGTITGINMNGASKGTSGVVDLGTVITAHQDISGKADKSSLATVATSGSYNDLSNKPTIPSAVTESTVSGWGFTKNAGTITGIKMNGATKGTSGVVDLGTVITSHQDIKTINGESLLGSGDVTTAYITDFSEFDLHELAGNQTGSIQFQIDALKQALADNKIILVPMGDDLDGYGVLAGHAEDLLYLSVSFGTGYSYQIETDAVEGTIYNSDVVRKDYVTEGGLRTINGQSLIGSGDITISGGGSGTITGVSANGTSIATSGVANIPAASTSVYGVTKLSSSTSSTSTSLAATASAVKAAYDLANSYKGTVTGVKVNGSTKSPSSGTVDIGNVVTSIKINGATKSPSSGVVDLGTISGGSGGGNGAYSQVNHGTNDTTLVLTPNTFHVWDEVASLVLTLGSESSGVANEFVFQFTSGSSPTTLTLPDNLKWASNKTPTISSNKIYQISILNGLAAVLEYNNAAELAVNRGTLAEGDMMSGATLTFEYPVASDLTIEFIRAPQSIYVLKAGQTTLTVDWDEPSAPQIVSMSPLEDNTYRYELV